MPESFRVSLGNHDMETRKSAESNFLSFWSRNAVDLFWFRRWDNILDWDPPFARWFTGGRINASYNALDVHQGMRSDKSAILWEGEDGSSRNITYGELWSDVQRFANVLKGLGVQKGDRVTIYLPMIPEVIVSMLACSRIGAIHTVIFSGFSATSIRERVSDSGSSVVITADGGFRRGTIIPLKETVDEAIDGLDCVRHVVVVERTKSHIETGQKDVLWNDLMSDASGQCDAEELDSCHPLYILYTSGTTGRPKGVLHGIGGYLTHIYSTFKWAFDVKESDVYFCTADVGWVTGHSYVVYGPLLHGATQVIYEGAPDYPDIGRIWSIIQKYGVTILYTTPTALRMLMRAGDEIPASFDLSSLRLLGTVGEPINPRVWKWYFDVIGGGRCPIIDTWWQTETGGMMISPLPGLETIALKPGSAAMPIPGVFMRVVDEDGNEVPAGTKGHLVIDRPWPGMLLTLWGDEKKYRSAYWSRYDGIYHTGDYAIRDSDGYLWVLGRADDVLKVAGHRIGTAELESCMVSHPDVVEAAACGVPDEIRGEVIIAFVVCREGIEREHSSLRDEIAQTVRRGVGPVATPAEIHFVGRLPKTRSGKIMRRLLKSMARGEKIGDVSTLEDGAAVSEVREVLAASKDAHP